MIKFKFLNVKNIFLKNVLMIAGGTAFAQIINFLLSPIITRLYTPEDYGALSVYVSILGLLGIISCLRYESAIIIADDDETAVNLVGLCFFILFSITIVLFFTISFSGDFLLTKLKFIEIIKYKYFIPIGVFLIGLHNIYLQWAYRRKNIKIISKAKFIQAFFNNSIKILFGISGKFKALGLISGHIAGESTGTTAFFLPFFRNDRHLIKEINWLKIKFCCRRYKDFPLYNAVSQLFNQAGLLLPALFMLSLYDSKTVGYYSLANAALSLPMSLVGNSIGDVFYIEAANSKNNPGQLKNLSIKLFKKLLLIGFIPLLVILFGGPFVFSIVFGKQWIEAGYFARILIIVIFARLIFMPIGGIFYVYEKQKEAFILDFLRVIFIVIIYFLSKRLLLKASLFILMYSITLSFVYLLTFFVSQRIMYNKIKEKQIIESMKSTNSENDL